MFRARPMAKVNLTLDVGRRRSDEYHELRSVFLRVALADRLLVRTSADRDTLAVSGLPCPTDGNLVLQAFDRLRTRFGLDLPALAAELDKQIPVGGGLGGGSSDGAAALALAAATWGVGLAPGVRSELALELGSDVPFFAADVPAALVEGRGERVTPLPPAAGSPGIVLAIGPAQLSTARAFARFDELRPPGLRPGSTDALVDAFQRGLSAEALAALTEELRDANDLWPAAASISPDLVVRREVLERDTGRPWLLSGSGPTLFAIYPSVDDARDAAGAIALERPAQLRDVILYAVDLENPDNAWRN